MLRRKGLPNIGLSCYMNSVLQAFYHIDELREYIMKTDFLNNESFVFYFQCLFKNLANSDKSDNLEVIFQVFKSFCERFQESKQGDANHFLTFILNKLDAEITFNYNKINRSSEASSNSNDRNIITNLFRGEQEDRIICEKCHDTEIRKTKQRFFTLPLVADKFKDSTIDDLLLNFLSTSNVQNMSCNECGHKDVYKHTVVTRWPIYLIINICRGQVNTEGRMIKINSNVEVKDNKFSVADNSNFYSNQKSDFISKMMEYNLQATINHFGNAYGGHYTCSSKINEEPVWLEFNDLHVKPVSDKSVISKSNNLLIFKQNWQTESV